MYSVHHRITILKTQIFQITVYICISKIFYIFFHSLFQNCILIISVYDLTKLFIFTLYVLGINHSKHISAKFKEILIFCSKYLTLISKLQIYMSIISKHFDKVLMTSEMLGVLPTEFDTYILIQNKFLTQNI